MNLDFRSDINKEYAAAMNYGGVDRFIVTILWWHFGAIILLTFTNSFLKLASYFPSPFAWRVIGLREALGAILVGWAAALIPALLRGKISDHYVWRVLVTVALTTYSYLFVFVSGGSIEMHFHFFMIMALLVIYSDWRLGWIVLVLTALHHAILNYLQPQWLYFYGRNDFSIVAHIIPVIGSAIFATLICQNNRRSVEALEDTKRRLEQDVLERTRAEEALRETQAELAHVTRVMTLGEMTASIAHEVNQPLAAVVINGDACLRWLAGQAPNLEEAQRAVERIIKDGNRASEVIGRIRALVKKAPPRQDWLDLNDIIREVIALTRSEMRRQSVALQTQLSANLPPVRGDRIQLQQVMLNLIMNGIEAMSGVIDRSRELRVSSGKDESKGVLVAVRDSGIGLNPESLAHLFDAFYTTKPQGMGMGLSISRSIIAAHGGRLWATPNAPQGAVFQFMLPVDGERVS